jgi:uncharacterized protein (TIGR03435 family)
MTVVLSILVKVTLVLIVALVAVRCSRRAQASMRHLILASALAVVAALPLAERALPALPIALNSQQTTEPLLPIVTIPATISRESTPVIAAGSSARPVRAPENRSSAPSITTLLAAAWAAGAIVCLVPVLLTPWHLRRLRLASRPWREDDGIARAIAAQVGSRPVALLVNDSVTAPLTCGIVRPAVVLPADAMQWPDDEVRRALVHELEHVRRADWCIHVATRVVCAIYWFHPLVWVAWRQLSLESERACDDAVLRMEEPTAYAQQLVTLAKRQQTSAPIPALSMAGATDLSARVAAVLDETQTRGRLGVARASVVMAAAALLMAAVAPLRAAQAGQATPRPAAGAPAFDVVSIKENKSGEAGGSMRRQPGRIIVTNFPMRMLIINAFGLQAQQLQGGPDWLDSARYDITAQFSGEIAVTEPGTVGPLNLMLQRVLADRFQLAVHTETREIPIYALTIARSDRALGPKLRPAATDCEAVMNAMLKAAREGDGPPPAAPQLPDGRPGCGMRASAGGQLTAGGTSMAALARFMTVPAGRIIVDKTGLTGGYDFDLEYTPDPPAPGGQPQTAPADSNKPSLFTALEEQLGLKLVPERGPVEMLVIDRVERPTEN